ncbi:NYN domain-containing protein [Thermoflexus sp.]|uniref:LabA-like NYN domain-containing protein n=1 Tax=Thermoflexus sp. TaxID=1969742 RepID=UPI002ADD402B|nr:NYN domain-containing protein [Thermoflexus sp.]
MRVAIFVDINNIFYAVREAHGGARVNYEKLREWAARQGELVLAAAFMAYDPGHSEQIEFMNALGRIGFRVEAFPVRLENGGRQRHGNADVALAAQAVLHAARFDRMILVSGDGDFEPLIGLLQAQGKEVWVAAPRNALSAVLARRADRVFLLEELAEEIPGLIFRPEEAVPPPIPRAFPVLFGEPSGAELARLARRALQTLQDMIRAAGGQAIQISRLGDLAPELVRAADRYGGLRAVIAVALLENPVAHLRAEGHVWMIAPGPWPQTPDAPDPRPLAWSGLARLPDPAITGRILEALAAIPPEETFRNPEDLRLHLAGVLEGQTSQEAIRRVLAALRDAGILRREDDVLQWPREEEALRRAVEEVAARRIRNILEQAPREFREKALRALGLPVE